MKKTITLILMLLSSIVGFSQSILSVSPNEGRRNQESWFEIFGSGTLFTESSNLVVSLKSNVDGSVITSMGFWAGEDTWCSGSVMIPETATPGLYSVSIQTSNQGKLTLANGFTVSNLLPYPKFIQLTPTSATHGDEVIMTITVHNGGFNSSSQVQVNMSGNFTYLSADSIKVVNDSTVNAVFNIPARNQSDMCYITVYTDNDYIYCNQSFEISGVDPAIVSISPNSASDGDQVDITIHTTQTDFTTAGYKTVSLQGGSFYLDAYSISIVNDSELVASFDIPLHTRSSICDLVVMSNGITFNSYQAFTINGANPELVDVSPAEAEQGTTLDVTISGVDMFFNGTSTTDITFYGNNGGYFAGASSVVLNDNQIKTTITIPLGAPLGLYALYMYIDGNSFELYDAFNVIDDGNPDPELVSVSPNTAARGDVLDVTITGAHTLFTQSSNLSVVLSGPDYIPAVSTTVLSNTQLKSNFTIPVTAQKGRYDLYVSDGTNYLFLEQSFTVTGTASDPRLVSITPGMTFPGQTLDVTITGANTHFMSSSTTLDMAIFSQTTYVQPSSINVLSNTTISARFEIPDDFPLDIYDFGLVSSIDGYLDLLQSILVNAVGLDEKTEVITNLYPNPVHDHLYIDTKSPVRSCTIVDITGKQSIVDPNEFRQDNTHIRISIDKLGLRKGIYFIRLESDNGFDYKKFIVE